MVQTSQHELETLLNSMQDAVIAVDAEGRVQLGQSAVWIVCCFMRRG